MLWCQTCVYFLCHKGCLEFIEMKHFRDLFGQNALYIFCHLGSEHSLMSRHFLAVPWPTHSSPSLQSWSAYQKSVFWLCDMFWPIRGQYSGYVTNQKPVFSIHLVRLTSEGVVTTPGPGGAAPPATRVAWGTWRYVQNVAKLQEKLLNFAWMEDQQYPAS